MDQLINADRALLYWINQHHSGVLDLIMFYSSKILVWSPFLAIIIWILYSRFKKRFLYLFLTMLVMIFISDQTSVMIKDCVGRFRPSHAPGVMENLHIVYNYYGGLFGFVSSHATNTMALGTFLWIFGRRTPFLRVFSVLFVVLNCYSRIYLGVHYPSDILGGLILGFVVGVGMAYLAWLAVSKNVLNLKD